MRARIARAGMMLLLAGTAAAAPAVAQMAAEGVTLGASFPPPVVAEVKPGDVVFVTVSVIDTRAATVTGSIPALAQAEGPAPRAPPRRPPTPPPPPPPRRAPK